MTSQIESDMNTLELAKLYESQEYYEDAHKIYLALAKNESSEQIQAGLERTQTNQTRQAGVIPEKTLGSGKDKVAALFKEWLMLLSVKQRIQNLKKLKTRHS